jgi:hypothetical protein
LQQFINAPNAETGRSLNASVIDARQHWFHGSSTVQEPIARSQLAVRILCLLGQSGKSCRAMAGDQGGPSFPELEWQRTLRCCPPVRWMERLQRVGTLSAGCAAAENNAFGVPASTAKAPRRIGIQ